MSNKTVTMSDVAERAQVSKVAVSVVLHGSHTNTRVAEATRQRIVKAAQDLQYTPNGVARALRRRQMNVIGLYLGDTYVDVRGLFMSETVAGIQIGCDEHRKDLLIHGSFRGRSVDDIYAELIGGKIDGLILLAKADDSLAVRLASSALPAIAIADTVKDIPSVVVDDRGGSALLAEYLAQQGHRYILYRRGMVAQTSTIRRREAFLEAAALHGITVVEDAIDAPFPERPFTPWEEDLMAGRLGPRPTAVACGLDRIAYAVIRDCHKLGLRVPEDVAVVGFDGILSEIPPATHLTTIKAPWEEVARTAVNMVMQRLAGKTVPLETILPVELVVGDTA